MRTKQIPKKRESGASASASVPETKERERKRRFHPGTVAIREIRRQQGKHGTGKLALQRAPFKALVKEIVGPKEGLRFRSGAITALQHAAEHMLVGVLRDANTTAVASKRVTLTREHLFFAYNRAFNAHIWQQTDATNRMLSTGPSNHIN